MDAVVIPKIDFRSECCGMALMFDEGNRLDEPPMNVDDASSGWSWTRWYCARCNRQHYSYDLCVGFPRLDPEVVWDGFHAAEKERYIRLSHAGVNVIGHEALNAVYENPAAGCRIRRYQLLAEYTFGPYQRSSHVLRAAREVTSAVLERAAAIAQGASLP